MHKTTLKRVVVTGLGAITPIGNTIKEYWNGLVEGKSGAKPITRFDTTHFKTKFACEVKNFDPLNYFDRKEARKMDLFSQFAMAATQEAVEDAALPLDKINLNKAGVIWASGIGGLSTIQSELLEFYENGRHPRFNPFFVTKMISNIPAGLISIKYGFKGVNFSTVSACTSSTHALIDAFNYIRLGKAYMIITGGSEASINETGMGGFNAMKALSERNDSPETASRPFDKDRDGFVLGEGAGTLILEELEHALQRDAKIYAEVVGGGATADAYHVTATHPEGEGARRAMQEALEDAGLQAADVDYVNVHATSTAVGDLSEAKAIEQLFGDHLSRLDISSTKSMTGHLLGAAGAIEAIASILSMQYNLIPPTINHQETDENISKNLHLTPNKAKEKTVHVAMSNTFGFGGHNAIAVFKKFDR